MKAAADLKLGNLATAEVLVDIALPSPSQGTNDMHVKFTGSIMGIDEVQAELHRMISKAQADFIKQVFGDSVLSEALSDSVDKLLSDLLKSFAVQKLAVAYDSNTSDGLQIELIVKLGTNPPLTIKIEIPDVAKIVITMVEKAVKLIGEQIEKTISMTLVFKCNGNCKGDEFCDVGTCKEKLNSGETSVHGAKSCKSGEHQETVCVDCVSDAQCQGTYTSTDRAKGWAPSGVQSTTTNRFCDATVYNYNCQTTRNNGVVCPSNKYCKQM